MKVAFHRRANGDVSLVFKPGITQSEVERAVALLERNGEADSVRAIYVFGEGCNGPALRHLLRLPGVESFSADGCTFGDDGVREIAAWANLKRLSLISVHFDPRVICKLAVLGQLARLEFDGKYLTDEVVDCLATFEHLDVVALTAHDPEPARLNRLRAELPHITVLRGVFDDQSPQERRK